MTSANESLALANDELARVIASPESANESLVQVKGEAWRASSQAGRGRFR
jgi:hypothetical protein